MAAKKQKQPEAFILPNIPMPEDPNIDQEPPLLKRPTPDEPESA